MQVGIESLNIYCGRAFISVETLFKQRGLDLSRMSNLMMKNKSVCLPWEDPITNAVNAAKPIIDALSEEERKSIQMVITATESGVDFGKSMSTYVHHYLGLHKNCRLFEVKQACYGGTAAFQTAINTVVSGARQGGKVLVIATDVTLTNEEHTYAEPAQGGGAVALLVSDIPNIFEVDFGANGFYSFEVMDTCRPNIDLETGDPDISLLSYLDCVVGSFESYSSYIEGIDIQNTFDYLAFHTPFAGMVKGAHRHLMRSLTHLTPEQIESDFQNRIIPSLQYCMQVGNMYTASLYLALCSLIEFSDIHSPARVGLFSYGSGCSSEFYSGIIYPESKKHMRSSDIAKRLQNRYELSMEQYKNILNYSSQKLMGVENKKFDFSEFYDLYNITYKDSNLLALKKIEGYHRVYSWA